MDPIEYDDPNYIPQEYQPSSLPPPKLSISPDATTSHASSNAASITIPSNAYITNLAWSSVYSSTFAAVIAKESIPRTSKDHALSIYDMVEAGHIRTFYGHEDTITKARVLNPPSGKPLWATSSADGTLRLWDDKSSSADACLKFRSPNQAGFLSFDLSADGSLLATGTELKGDGAPILFWDIRKPKEPLYIHAMTHSDDVTVLEFSSAANSNQELLLSGSSDGLLSISSPREQDEEEAVSQVGNWRCSVSKCGWAGQDSAGQPLVWSVSDMESFATWNHQMELLDNYVDLRLAKLEGTWETKNVIDATWTADPAPLVSSQSSASDLLGVWVGTSDGNIGLMTSSSRQGWSLHRTFHGGHTSIVRSILWAPGVSTYTFIQFSTILLNHTTAQLFDFWRGRFENQHLASGTGLRPNTS
ncbi:hypothetical protein FRC03_005287 [Tulasnella sp. 419]|nr:hypothetical protein FRC03_005287 [Tulasnella sp. 419]